MYDMIFDELGGGSIESGEGAGALEKNGRRHKTGQLKESSSLSSGLIIFSCIYDESLISLAFSGALFVFCACARLYLSKHTSTPSYTSTL